MCVVCYAAYLYEMHGARIRMVNAQKVKYVGITQVSFGWAGIVQSV